MGTPRYALLVVVSSVLFHADASGGPWQAGTARVNITPIEPMWMSGYASRDRPATGKLTDLWAKALALQDDAGHRGVLITLDIVGIDRSLSTAICEELIATYGLERREIVLAVSHTHTGPVIGANLMTMAYGQLPDAEKQKVDDYAVKLQTAIVEVVGRAIDAQRPCRLAHGMGTASFAVNRRNNVETEAPALRAAGALRGPIDHDVPVLAVRTLDDKLAAVVFGYACHATVLGDYNWSGDYPGFAMAELESLYPECQAMFWAGCGADQNPLPRRTVEVARHYGRRLANAVDAVLLTSKMAEVEGPLETSMATIDLEFATVPSEGELRTTAESSNPFERARAQALLQQATNGQSLSKTYPYPVAVWKLGGQLQWVTLGGEVVVDYALRLKAELGGTVWATAYAHDVMAYIPSRRVLAEGGYEGGGAMVYYGLPGPWAPTVEDAIVHEVRRQATVP